MSRNRALTFALLLMFHHLKSFLFLFFFFLFFSFLRTAQCSVSFLPTLPFGSSRCFMVAELQEERLERSSQAAGEVG